MHEKELYDLTEWVRTNVRERGVVDLYSNLVNILHQNTQPNQPRTSWQDAQKQLVSVVSGIDLGALTRDQLRMLERLHIAQHIGQRGVEAINEILGNSLDLAAAHEVLRRKHKALNKGLTDIDQLRTALLPLGVAQEPARPDDVVIRVGFEGDAQIQNVTDFKNWGETWYDIGRGLAMSQGLAPEDVRIVGAKTGSIVLELAVTSLAVVKVVAWILQEGLKVTERYLGIMKQVQEVKGLRLANEKIARELEQEANDEKTKDIDAIVAGVVERLEKQLDGEVTTALRRSITKLVEFLKKGGEVDISVPADKESKISEEERQSLEDLRRSISEVRRLEHSVKQIEHKPQSDKPEQPPPP